MRAITSKKKVLQKLNKNNLLWNGSMFYLTDFHATKIGYAVASKMIAEGLLEPTVGLKKWFEKEWKLKKV